MDSPRQNDEIVKKHGKYIVLSRSPCTTIIKRARNMTTFHQMGSNLPPGLNNRQKSQEIQRLSSSPCKTIKEEHKIAQVYHIGNKRHAELSNRVLRASRATRAHKSTAIAKSKGTEHAREGRDRSSPPGGGVSYCSNVKNVGFLFFEECSKFL